MADTKWTVRNDLGLLQAIRKFGYGNWQQVFQYLSLHNCLNAKSKYQSHINDLLYLLEDQNSSDVLLKASPSKFKWRFQQWNKLVSNKIPKQHGQQRVVYELNYSIELQQSKQNSRSLAQRENLTSQYEKSQPIQMQSQTSQQSPTIYRSQREQFLIQHDPYAQSLIANLQFTQDDTQQEIFLKENLLRDYNRKLRQRIKRKKFVVKRNLLNHNHNQKAIFTNQQVFQTFSLKNSQLSLQNKKLIQSFNRVFSSQEQRKFCQQKLKEQENAVLLINTMRHFKLNTKNYQLSSIIKKVKNKVNYCNKVNRTIFKRNNQQSIYSEIDQNLLQIENKIKNEDFVLDQSSKIVFIKY